jgi:hypothetical protein
MEGQISDKVGSAISESQGFEAGMGIKRCRGISPEGPVGDKQRQRAVWRARAPILKRFAREFSIWAKGQGKGNWRRKKFARGQPRAETGGRR